MNKLLIYFLLTSHLLYSQKNEPSYISSVQSAFNSMEDYIVKIKRNDANAILFWDSTTRYIYSLAIKKNTSLLKKAAKNYRMQNLTIDSNIYINKKRIDILLQISADSFRTYQSIEYHLKRQDKKWICIGYVEVSNDDAFFEY